jgi:hypothetical protein
VSSFKKKEVHLLYKKAITYVVKWVSAIQLNRLYLLETQKHPFEIRKEYLESFMSLDRVFTDLERHLGGSLLKEKARG